MDTPCEALARSRRANLLETQGRTAEAEQVWREVLDGPWARFATFRLATLLERSGRVAEAEQVWRDAAVTDPMALLQLVGLQRSHSRR